MAWARTWGFANGHALQDLVTHLPQHHDRRSWVPLDAPGRRRTYWTYTKWARLRHSGDGTIVLSQQRRHDGPKQTKMLVTNLPDARARQVVEGYRRRWSVALLMKALKGATGLGQHQVTKDPQRVERSLAISVMAYLLIVKWHAQDIPQKGPWSLYTLKRNFMWQRAQGQLKRAAEQRLQTGLWERKAA
jgi:hypothetical protein